MIRIGSIITADNDCCSIFVKDDHNIVELAGKKHHWIIFIYAVIKLQILSIRDFFKDREKLEKANYKKLARQLEIKFIDMQKIPNGPALPMFLDPETGTTFIKSKKETLRQALERKRKQFHYQEKKAREIKYAQ